MVQKFYPIYKDPDPDHMVDFNAQFYMPAKHFLNQNIDTPVFQCRCDLVDDYRTCDNIVLRSA
ncbi:MAG: hypothetical protein WDO15_20810 [Bacteroidota bacterium]